MNELAPPGSFGLSIIGGTTGSLIAAGQALIGDGSRFTHAFIVLDKGEIIEAMPHGARITKLSERADDLGGIVICDGPVQRAMTGVDKIKSPGAEAVLRDDIVGVARELIGTKYNFLDYFYLGMAHFGMDSAWLRNRIANNGHLICSQLVDQVYNLCGIHLFNDGRLPMDVTPGDLDNWRVADQNWSGR